MVNLLAAIPAAMAMLIGMRFFGYQPDFGDGLTIYLLFQISLLTSRSPRG